MDLYKYIDKNGIPFRRLASFGIQLYENDLLNRLKLTSDEQVDYIAQKGELIVSKYKSQINNRPDFPDKFQLNRQEQEQLAIDWLEDTTGYSVDSFSTLFSLPMLNGRPFLIQLERRGDNYNLFYLVLATKEIKGDIIVREKYHRHTGIIQENFINTFGQITKIRGTVGIDGALNDFGELREITGDLWFSNHVYQKNLDSIYPLSIVGGDLNLKNTHCDLSSLVEVKGNLNLRKTTSRNLNSLKYVGGNILVSKCQKEHFDFSSVEVKGKIKSFNDSFNERELTLPKYLM